MIDLVYYLLIGLTAGWLAGKIKRDQSSSLVENLAMGVMGAVPGGFIFPHVGLSATGLLGSLMGATAGAILLLFLFKCFGKSPEALRRSAMAGKGRQMPHKPVTKFAGIVSKISKRKK
jgi:uncharacterized membrane protein YeaQ/YmgE (transglycosylase-associated protein family)